MKVSPFEFTGTPKQMRVMYEHGWGVAEIMERSGKSYEQVMMGLREAGTVLITGGPHDTGKCLHNHDLADAHARGARCCEPKRGRRR